VVSALAHGPRNAKILLSDRIFQGIRYYLLKASQGSVHGWNMPSLVSQYFIAKTYLLNTDQMKGEEFYENRWTVLQQHITRDSLI
jgi:hypothetical protein